MRYLFAVAFCLVASAASAQGYRDLAWDPPTGGSPATGYIVQVGASPGATESVADVGPNTTFRVTFSNTGRYYVRVVAYNDLCCSMPSNELTIDIPIPLPPMDPCVAEPLTATVTTWPEKKRAAVYTASHPIQNVTWLTRRGNQVYGAVFTDIRGCMVTITK